MNGSMPGVIDSEIGFSREVGKMAFSLDVGMPTDLLEFDAAELEEMAERLLSPSDRFTRFDFSDNEGDFLFPMLPDEPTVDLVKIMDDHEYNSSLTLPKSMIMCDPDCDNCHETASKKSSGNPLIKDPFIGTASHGSTCMNNTVNASLLGLIMNPLEDTVTQQHPKQEVFSAWNHVSNTDDDHSFTKSSFTGLSYQEDYNDDTNFQDTSSTYSDNAVLTGDDSDVDIETVTETPRSSLSMCGSSLDCSPYSTPSTSPTPIQNIKKGSLMTILSHSAVSPKLLAQTSSAKSLLHGLSSSASLAENLMVGRSISGQKRKLEKKKALQKIALQQPVYSHVLSNSNSVNFHDYAMSPVSNITTIETGRPTVMAKRMYRKRQYNSFDPSDKEKQHHHNQLERNRRQKLADLFTDLRDEVPKIQHHSKASKVVILQEATDYINELHRLEAFQESEMSSLLQKQIYLEKILREAQRSSIH